MSPAAHILSVIPGVGSKTAVDLKRAQPVTLARVELMSETNSLSVPESAVAATPRAVETNTTKSSESQCFARALVYSSAPSRNRFSFPNRVKSRT